MRHRRRGRKLGRRPKHQRALLRNLACALFLTERDSEGEPNAPKVKGRIITTLEKAKEVRPLVEKCIAIACRALPHEEAAEQLEPDTERGSAMWRKWRNSREWQEWNRTIAPAVAARRRVLRLLGDKQAVRILFDEIAPRMADRPGGYTRILKLAHPRLGDAGRRAILELVGKHDRVRRRAEKPAFEKEPEEEPEEEAQEDVQPEAAAAEAPEQTVDEAAGEPSETTSEQPSEDEQAARRHPGEETNRPA
ncbi:MAG TPA: 50S ribosomal protein L17 [Planctomycetaceae bacterium]|nr:50S ribosomal protein L17 [Planctomycetaceae bacterium]HIQ23328.1 50S ribosomal protein L17 [Planctomycetota bacterium]